MKSIRYAIQRLGVYSINICFLITYKSGSSSKHHKEQNLFGIYIKYYRKYQMIFEFTSMGAENRSSLVTKTIVRIPLTAICGLFCGILAYSKGGDYIRGYYK